jgi:hypothetical protein
MFKSVLNQCTLLLFANIVGQHSLLGDHRGVSQCAEPEQVLLDSLYESCYSIDFFSTQLFLPGV